MNATKPTSAFASPALSSLTVERPKQTHLFAESSELQACLERLEHEERVARENREAQLASLRDLARFD